MRLTARSRPRAQTDATTDCCVSDRPGAWLPKRSFSPTLSKPRSVHLRITMQPPTSVPVPMCGVPSVTSRRPTPVTSSPGAQQSQETWTRAGLTVGVTAKGHPPIKVRNSS
ncbi:hypothetical protein C8034_v000093 [Colletotrichum sidae]|uniref:Uncharacterized protein n=1 Tax=Colletotrichum sidae TaxID=1347389 RepID=A0A4R8SME4_9PEZI|nr:hypothetical protein C8034_v000093 [Colletotrichum sidae]